MATILFAWECGGGNGHLTRYRQLINHLHDQGHETYFVARNLRSAAQIYPDKKTGLLAAPLIPNDPNSPNRIIRPESYLDVLTNQCFDSQEGLQTRIRAWLSIFRVIAPSLIIVDHAPTALMAYKLYSQCECLIYGEAFGVPPTKNGILPFSPNSGLTSDDLHKQDKRLVDDFLNPCIAKLNGPKLSSCMDIFNPPQRIFGIPELDHYANAKRAELFIGHQKTGSGKDVVWPNVEGPKVFIYSENHPHLRPLLKILSELKWPVVAVAKHSARKLMSEFQTEHFSYSEELLNMEQIAQECDFAITNANMATCMNFIESGKPMLLLPAHIEQTMFAQRLVDNNCAINLIEIKELGGLRSAVQEIGTLQGPMHIHAKQFALETQPSFHRKVDETMIEEVTSLLN